MKLLLCFLLFVASAESATQAEVTALQDSIDAAESAAGRQRTVDALNAMIVADSLTALATNSVTVIADAMDSVWVEIDVPLSTATGFAKSYWIGWLEYAKQVYKAKDGDATGRVRMRKDRAEDALRALDANLKAQ
tara:strand:+ start:3603 stop:4007 length:405 start_codon:yes stop_codon:yes gene_type:complete